jgi:hypothetical protein
MDLTEENIKKLKSLVRVSMDMHDYENWKNGEYFGDARKFWDGAMSGIDLWVDKMRESQNASTSDEALLIGDVVGKAKRTVYLRYKQINCLQRLGIYAVPLYEILNLIKTLMGHIAHMPC